MLKYKILAVMVVVVYFLQSFFLNYGGIGADSLSYFGIATDFPELKTNLFPFAYPLFLRGLFLFFQDYFWAYKFLNLFFTIFMLLFSWRKKFFFRETVLLFMGKTLFFSFTNAISESLFVFLLYFLIYHIYRIIHNIEEKKHVFLASIIMMIMFLTRYSGLYIYLGIGCMFLWMFYKKKEMNFFNPLFFFLLFSGFGMLGYLIFNFIHFGSFFGEQIRGNPSQYTFLDFTRNIFGMMNVLNPFIGIKPSSNGYLSLGFQFVIFLMDITLFSFFLKYIKTVYKDKEYVFHQLLWFVAFVYSFCLLLSGFFQQIEELNVRMLAAANFCIFFSMLILAYKHQENEGLFLSISVFFWFFLVGYNLKNPVDFMDKRNEIKKQVVVLKGKKYLFNDEKNKKQVTKYYIPILNKEFQYAHTNNQIGEIKQSIAGSVRPDIKWLKKDTVRNKSSVLYTSQLILK